MSETEYEKVARQLEQILTNIAVIQDKLSDYQSVRDTTLSNAEKLRTIIDAQPPVGQTKSGIIIGICVGCFGVVVTIIGAIINKLF